MKLLLSTSPHVRHPAVLERDFQPDASVMYCFAPVGLLSLVAAVRAERAAVDCRLYDLNRSIISGAHPLDGGLYLSVAEEICAWEPDVVGFMTECDSFHHVLQLCAAVKKIRTRCIVLLGGPHASAVARTALARAPFVDAIVVGEGELTIIDVVDRVATNGTLAVPGAVARTADGQIVDGGHRSLIEDLDRMAIPAYDLYHPDIGEEIFIEVGRGCPFQCEFCSTAPYWRRRHRVKSPTRILSEVHLVRDLYGTERVHFTHDLFTTNRDWVQEVCGAFIDAGVPIQWTCSARVDTVDEDLISRMAQAGCNAIYFGIESGSSRILREIKKEIPLADTVHVLEACLYHGIQPNAGLIVGFPTEDSDSFADTLTAYEQVLRRGCRPTHVFAYCPFADSSLYSRLTGLRCSGHFVDLPLGSDTDLANRELVMSDCDLFGSYFRPFLPNLVDGDADALMAVDEFSPLVEAALAPTLALSEVSGGMVEVFRQWLSWIRHHNRARGAASFREGYGSAADYAAFLLDALSAATNPAPEALAAARVLWTNLRAVSGTAPVKAITMSGHRSFHAPEEILLGDSLSLDQPLASGSVVAKLALEVDATPALFGSASLNYAKSPTFLIWQALGDGGTRLLQVTGPVFEALQELESSPRTVGELLNSSRNRSLMNAAHAIDGPDEASFLRTLSDAAHEGLIVSG